MPNWGDDAVLVGEGFLLLVCMWGEGQEEADAVRLGTCTTMTAPNARSICLGCSPVPIPLSPPECASRSAHVMCSEQQAWLFVPFWDNRLQYSSAPPPRCNPQAALVNIICICWYYFCHFLTLLFALVPLFPTPVSSILNPPIIAFFPPWSHFIHIHLNLVNLRWQDWSWWPCVAVCPSRSSALPFPCLWHSCQAPLHPSVKSLKPV